MLHFVDRDKSDRFYPNPGAKLAPKKDTTFEVVTS